MTTYDYMFKLVIIGAPGVGKTNILSKFAFDKFQPDSVSTLGVEYSIKTIEVDFNGQKQNIKLTIWDTAGQERYQSVTKTYFRGAQGAIIVYDITNKTTFEQSNDWLQRLKDNSNEVVDTMLIGNKSDLEESRQVQVAEGQNEADKQGLLFIETSAMTGNNIEDAFKQIVLQIMKRKLADNVVEEAPREAFKAVVIEQEPAPEAKKGCC
ncbi:Rab11 [Hexamita inflata]|uniref:Rab11 n=1 Tax=Hexamita inflata TaxID=28002 RepID=A0AA86V4G8_9EUKA|nr:Rab11 [Hexamita inflata]